jgi:hypothetical protein
MKKVFLSISLLVSFYLAFAQITITHEDLLDVGDSVELAGVENIPPGFGPGPSGPNQYWDFSNLTADTLYTLGFIDPTLTPYASSFPFSNVAAEGLIEGFGAEGFAYATKNSSVFQIDGFAGSYDVFEDVAVPFEPAEVMFDFPVNYLDSMIQTSVLQARVDSPEPGIDSIWLKMVSTVETKVDAWGEVVTPKFTGNVLRIKDYRTTIDTVFIKVIGFWIYLESSTSVSQTYKYMTNGLGYPVIQFNTDESGTEFTMINYLMDVNTVLQDVSRQEHDFRVYPNPSSDILYIDIAERSFSGEIIIFDVMGRMTEKHVIEHASEVHKLDVSSYAPGLYQAVLKDNNTLVGKKKFVVN